MLRVIGDGKPGKSEACSTQYDIITQVDLVINDIETSIIVMDSKEIMSLNISDTRVARNVRVPSFL